MSKLRRIKKLLTARQLPHHYGAIRKIMKQTRIAQARKHRKKS